MAIAFEQVRAALIPEEPNYQSAAALGAEALPHLKSMVEGGEPLLAAKAAYLASLIDDEHAIDVLLAAATNPEPTVRVAAAAGTRNLPPSRAEAVREVLASDEDAGVRAKNAKAAGLDDSEIWESAEPAFESAEPEPEPPPAEGRMPGERAPADQPGGLMPGESDVVRHAVEEGLMPGESEALRRAVTTEGLMPGERPSD